ncbi:hypothetical protein FEO87_20490 [Stenotrophomonas maltophilia]|nr:hypothetical protein FEO87_20490 [Stenotrophomonas maltophilia]
MGSAGPCPAAFLQAALRARHESDRIHAWRGSTGWPAAGRQRRDADISACGRDDRHKGAYFDRHLTTDPD